MTHAFSNFPKVFILTIPLVLGSFVTGVYFRGTDSILVFPHLAMMVAFGVISLWPGFKKGFAWPGSVVVVALLLYWACVWVSGIWSTNPYNSTLFALIFSVLPFMFFVLVLTPEPRERLGVYLALLAAGIAAMAVWAIIQLFILDAGVRVHDPMLNPNNLAVVFNMALFPALALYFSSRERVPSVLGLVLAVLFVSALFVTQSRGAILAFIAASLLFFMLARGQDGFTVAKTLLFWAVAIVVFVAVHFLSHGLLGSSFGHIVEFAGGEKNFVAERPLIWASTWSLIQEHFWTGTGLGTFIYFYPRFRSPDDLSDGYFAHMDPLQFWAEMGVFAPVLFYAVLITILFRTVAATRACAPSSQERLWLYGFFCGMLVLAAHAHISFHLYMPIILFLAAFLMAGWFLVSEKALNEERKVVMADKSRVGLGAKAVFILVLVIGLVWMGRAAAGVYFVNRAAPAMQQNDFEKARAVLDMAARFAPQNYSVRYDYEARYALDRLRTRKDLSPEQRRKLYDDAHRNVDMASAYNEGFANLWNLKALIYFAGVSDLEPDGQDKAIALLEKVVEANPYFLDARIGLGHVYRLKGEDEKARALYEEVNRLPVLQRILARRARMQAEAKAQAEARN